MSEKKFEHLFWNGQGPLVPPRLDSASYLIDGEIRTWNGPMEKVYSPVFKQGDPNPIEIGSYAMLDSKTAVEAVDAAAKAYNSGRGVWPRLRPMERIAAVEKFLRGLKAKRDEIVNLLLWEICKNSTDAAKEVDRTIKYVEDTIKALKDLENSSNKFVSDSGVVAQIRRSPIGVSLCCGPMNYPFNETYVLLFPSLLMGNTVIVKLPRVGILCHFPTLELFRDCFPPGVVNVISGSGRSTLPPIMKTAKVDIFGFIGTSKAADEIQKAHPTPHRLRVCLGLEAKNPAIIFPDADLSVAIPECVTGSTSFNGQRCTALKIIMVHESIADTFIPKFADAIDALKLGCPWESGVSLTPLPEPGKPAYIKELLDDALEHGAKVINKNAGHDRTMVFPSVVYPVNSSMRVYNEEQFGPIIPIVTFKNTDELYEYLAQSQYGQQASVFSKSPDTLGEVIDVLVNQVARVNINSLSQRGPDSLPFTGRKDSAYGTLSISDALRVFSIRTCVAAKDTSNQTSVLTDVMQAHKSQFLRMEYHF